MLSGLGGRVHDSQDQYHLSLETTVANGSVALSKIELAFGSLSFCKARKSSSVATIKLPSDLVIWVSKKHNLVQLI